MLRCRISRGVLAVSAPVLMAAPAGCIGNGGTENHYVPSLGQQLIDLKTARDVGAINDQEYRNAKDDLLRKQS